MDVLEQSLKKGFINKEIESSKYDPQLIINQPAKNNYVLNTIQNEIDTCTNFFFSIAFITQAGINGLKSHLSDLNRRGITGKILTSTYLLFNHPDVFESLLNIPNLEVRISKKVGFHAKGYLFDQADYRTFIIGSSNLTMNALKQNYEWNIRLTSYENGDIIHQVTNQLKEDWATAVLLTSDWIKQYRVIYKPVNYSSDFSTTQDQTLNSNDYIVPNQMQKTALTNLKNLRKSGAEKALIISATGTGKTYLAAFDVLQFQPKKMLFIVHREQILNKAKESFEKIIGGDSSDYGVLSGNTKELDAKYLFATIQTISKPKYQELFNKKFFDYILIDEVHKAGAKTYLSTLNYFDPDFLLGMTATPERTDNFNIFELFDYNIAYEIRLQEALEEDFLCPFHYFGVTDYEKDNEIISETSDLNLLTTSERVDFLIEKINYYGCSHNDPKGLIFCSRKEEAINLCNQFNQAGIKSSYLIGDNSILEREIEIEKLEAGLIHYIFTVDIFNEGIDIPKINQVIMLRNTKSNIIFIQQLGRGLRKDSSKEFVTIIDFIGNYKNNYMIPMALSGDLSRNKDSLRKDTFDTNFITGISSINFEEIAKERIYKSINQAALDSMKELKEIFQSAKYRLNRTPMLIDFLDLESIDPYVIAAKYKSYYNFLVKLKEQKEVLSDRAVLYLNFLTSELLPGKRPHDSLLLKRLLVKKRMTLKQVSQLFSSENLVSSEDLVLSTLDTLSLNFYTGTFKKNYEQATFISFDQENVWLTTDFLEELHNKYFQELLIDTLNTALKKSKSFNQSQLLTPYLKYRRRDVLRLLNWSTQMVDQNIGGYTYKNNKFVIFVTLDKGASFKGALMAYEDELIDEQTMRWFTKSPRTLNSPEVKILSNPIDWDFFVFAKKSDDEGTEFYYLGKVSPVLDSIQQLKKPLQEGKEQNVVELDLKFHQPIETTLYKYLQK
ncbi:DUF3427 domain-containing protein [Enterococcus sp. AZ103]|uniref:DUF3427 domain-containing protein n=1 Tax=Enterococcus sp. AZ103 TaxID=2774628 RepID=UPI003F207209